ncbi:hypothetical protein WJ63_22085 [Burkholderia pyrrocinia]|nr:hypothetical protein WJ63_22085 [Burkholderia pyrrocinia]
MLPRRLPSKRALPTRMFAIPLQRMHPLPTDTWPKHRLSKRTLSTRMLPIPLLRMRPLPTRMFAKSHLPMPPLPT